MAIALFEFDTQLVGSSSIAPNKYKIHHAESAGNGLYRLKEAVVEDVFTGKMMKADQRLKQGDIQTLKQNWIVNEALTAFASNGTIPCVPYTENLPLSPTISHAIKHDETDDESSN